MLTLSRRSSPSSPRSLLWTHLRTTGVSVARVASRLAIAAVGTGCGDLVIPNGADAGETAAQDDGGVTPVDDSAAVPGGDDARAVSADAAADGPVRPNCDAGPYPVALACTGLYTNWAQLTLAPDVAAYQVDPRTRQWVDGATEREWVWLPPTQKITTTDLNNWAFPNGTKFWQELSLLGNRIETRFLWKLSTGQWFRTTFVWSADQTAAPSLATGSLDASGTAYDIPSVSQCDQCHQGAHDTVLGYEIVSLSLPGATGLDLQALKQQTALSDPPTAAFALPSGDATAPDEAGVLAPSLAYLHANCGTSCHNRNPDANAGPTGLFLKLTVDATGALPSVERTDTWLTSLNVPSSSTLVGTSAAGFWRLRPGDAAHSTLAYTMARRNNAAQMPPIGSELVDQNAVSTVTRWIDELASGDGGAPGAGLDAGGPEASGPASLDSGSMAVGPASDASLGGASPASDAASVADSE